MTIEQAIKWLEALKHTETISAVKEAIDLAIKALEGPKWIPVTFRQMTEEEVEEACEKWGVKEDVLDEYDKRVFTCPLPEDGQQILVSHGGIVTEDICSWDEDFCGLEYYGDWDGIDAWTLPPDPYKKGEVT